MDGRLEIPVDLEMEKISGIAGGHMHRFPISGQPSCRVSWYLKMPLDMEVANYQDILFNLERCRSASFVSWKAEEGNSYRKL